MILVRKNVEDFVLNGAKSTTLLIYLFPVALEYMHNRIHLVYFQEGGIPGPGQQRSEGDVIGLVV